MSLRDEPLFSGAFATAMHLQLWKFKRPRRAIPPRAGLLDRDRKATPFFLRLWSIAFPTRKSLPLTALSDANGVATDDYWNVFQ